MHKMYPGIYLTQELQVKVKLYRAACSMSDGDTHFFLDKDNSCSRVLLMSVLLHNYI